VACLQELASAQASAVSQVLPHGKLEPGSGPRDHDGMGIALRRPARVQRLPLRRRDGRVAELLPGDWPGLPAPVEVLNIHLQAPHGAPPWRSFRQRRDQVRGIDAYLHAAPRPYRILAGDLNATPRWPAYRWLAGRFEDAAAGHARRAGSRVEPTWGPLRLGRAFLRIDHVLVLGFEVLHVAVVPIPGSDHRAVLAELRPAPVRPR
jgi:endonuclease/exonuclease/phosphatase family metal-dependent hydrolase